MNLFWITICVGLRNKYNQQQQKRALFQSHPLVSLCIHFSLKMCTCHLNENNLIQSWANFLQISRQQVWTVLCIEVLNFALFYAYLWRMKIFQFVQIQWIWYICELDEQQYRMRMDSICTFFRLETYLLNLYLNILKFLEL
jgi:hypothetical protein